MLRELEKDILTSIKFVDRFINATNRCTRNRLTNYKLDAKEIDDSLKGSTLRFKNKSGQYFTDVDKDKYIFRLLFDIKGDSILTYIFVLKGDKFVDNGLSNFGYLLKYFDIEGRDINQNLGFNSKDEFLNYLNEMISIFHDFVKEFINDERSKEN